MNPRKKLLGERELEGTCSLSHHFSTDEEEEEEEPALMGIFASKRRESLVEVGEPIWELTGRFKSPTPLRLQRM